MTVKAESAIPVTVWIRLTKHDPDIQVHLESPSYGLDGDNGMPDMTTCTQGLTFRMDEMRTIPVR